MGVCVYVYGLRLRLRFTAKGLRIPGSFFARKFVDSQFSEFPSVVLDGLLNFENLDKNNNIT